MSKSLIKTMSIFVGALGTAYVAGYTTGADSTDSQKVSIPPTKISSGPTYDLPQQIAGIPMLSGITWAGEMVPVNSDIQERLDREMSVNAYWQSSTLLNIKMANRCFPTIERVLAEQGVPDDFKYLAVAESSLRNVTSSAAAKGYWQFREPSAKEWGLEINREIDERYHLEKSTIAAARYLKYLHNKFGSWTDAAAAYNIGPTRYARILEEQEMSNYYDLHLNDETSRYVFRLIAIKEIMKNPAGFGYQIDPKDLYTEDDVYSLEITETVPSWAKFAKQKGISYRLLKYYNPWLVDSKLTVVKNTYMITLPR